MIYFLLACYLFVNCILMLHYAFNYAKPSLPYRLCACLTLISYNAQLSKMHDRTEWRVHCLQRYDTPELSFSSVRAEYLFSHRISDDTFNHLEWLFVRTLLHT